MPRGGQYSRSADSYHAAIRYGLRSVVPLSLEPAAEAFSRTSFNAFGCVYTTAPADPMELALTLVHEFQHAKFTLLSDQTVLFEPDETCRFYAPWRDDPRPILGLLHGIYAFFGIADFWRVQRKFCGADSWRGHVEFARWHSAVKSAISQAHSSGLLTSRGSAFLDALADSMSSWDSEDVPEGARRVAAELLMVHHTYWRIKNTRPSRDAVLALAENWTAKRPMGRELPESNLVAEASRPNHPGRDQASPIRDTADADPARLVELYLDLLQADPIRPHGWAGLVPALQRRYPHRELHLLGERPEIIAYLFSLVALDSTDSAGRIELVLELVRWCSEIAGQKAS